VIPQVKIIGAAPYKIVFCAQDLPMVIIFMTMFMLIVLAYARLRGFTFGIPEFAAALERRERLCDRGTEKSRHVSGVRAHQNTRHDR